MYPYRPGRFPSQIPITRPTISPFHQMQQMPMRGPLPQPRGFGGFLSKILGKGSGPATFPNMGYPVGKGMFMPPNAGGVFYGGGAPGASGLSNMMSSFSSGGIPGMLGNVQKVMGLAQQFGPMIQQYGPLVKNMPAMLKIMKELNNTDSTDDNDENIESVESINIAQEEFQEEKELPDFNQLKDVEQSKNISVKLSKPKLYI